MRYRGAAGGAEKAHSRQRRWCLWSKPVNLGTWGLVPDPIAMAHAFAELGYGTVVHTTLAKTVSNVGTFSLRPFIRHRLSDSACPRVVRGGWFRARSLSIYVSDLSPGAKRCCCWSHFAFMQAQVSKVSLTGLALYFS